MKSWNIFGITALAIFVLVLTGLLLRHAPPQGWVETRDLKHGFAVACPGAATMEADGISCAGAYGRRSVVSAVVTSATSTRAFLADINAQRMVGAEERVVGERQLGGADALIAKVASIDGEQMFIVRNGMVFMLDTHLTPTTDDDLFLMSFRFLTP